MTEKRYQELYKRYRPNNWASLIGQERVAKSLQTAVRANKLPSAYLFAGPRGCGKTSSAFLMAKSINCLNAKNAEPCNECDVCINIDNGVQLGVNYLSASNISSGGADKIRSIVQEAKLTQPVKLQVWIIDEVHSLSRQAFDSLLIPLEEVSTSALFIFCTTEIDRVPQTILSRVQQRRFSLVDAENMKKLLERVIKEEGLDASEDVVNDAIRRGRGSVRDTLTAFESILDTGEYTLSYSGQLLEDISKHDLTAALATISQAVKDGNEPDVLAEQLFEDLRNLLLSAANVSKDLIGVIPVSDETAVIKGFINKQGIMFVMDEVGKAITEMNMGSSSRINMEIGVIKAISLLKRLKKAVTK